MFEIGQWVKSEDGIGQVIWIRPLKETPFFRLSGYEKDSIDNYGNYKYFVVVKYFLNSKFIVLKNYFILSSSMSWIRPLLDEEKAELSIIKDKHAMKYFNFLVFDQFHERKLYGELYFSIPKNNVKQLKEDLADFKVKYSRGYFTINDLDHFLISTKSNLNLKDSLEWAERSNVDPDVSKLLVLQFFTTTEYKIVNGNVCLIDFNTLWR